MRTRIHCQLCGALARHLCTRTAHDSIRVARPYSFYACRRCGVRFQPTPEAPEDPYGVEKQHTRPDRADERRYVHWDDDAVREIQRVVPEGRLLDFGSGYGDMLSAARAAGYVAEGVDICPWLAEEAERRSGCPVWVAPLHDLSFQSGSFQVVNAHFVLEYVPDPVATIRELARILAPGGVLRICAYVHDSLPASLRGASWWNYAPTRRYVFAERTLTGLAARAGLELYRAYRGGEQSAASFLQERPRRTAWTTAIDLLRYYATRIPLPARPLQSRVALYFRRPAALVHVSQPAQHRARERVEPLALLHREGLPPGADTPRVERDRAASVGR